MTLMEIGKGVCLALVGMGQSVWMYMEVNFTEGLVKQHENVHQALF